MVANTTKYYKEGLGTETSEGSELLGNQKYFSKPKPVVQKESSYKETSHGVHGCGISYPYKIIFLKSIMTASIA